MSKRKPRDLHNYVSREEAARLLGEHARTIITLKPGTLVKFAALRVETWRPQ